MKEWLLLQMVPAILSYIKSLGPASLVRSLVDKVFDAVEDFVFESETKLDDSFVIPIIREFRDAFNIPDNDEVVPE